METDASRVWKLPKTEASYVLKPTKTDASCDLKTTKTVAPYFLKPTRTDAPCVLKPAKTNASYVLKPTKTDAAHVWKPTKTGDLMFEIDDNRSKRPKNVRVLIACAKLNRQKATIAYVWIRRSSQHGKMNLLRLCATLPCESQLHKACTILYFVFRFRVKQRSKKM